jgi:hypothetical protein
LLIGQADLFEPLARDDAGIWFRELCGIEGVKGNRLVASPLSDKPTESATAYDNTEVAENNGR